MCVRVLSERRDSCRYATAGGSAPAFRNEMLVAPRLQMHASAIAGRTSPMAPFGYGWP